MKIRDLSEMLMDKDDPVWHKEMYAGSVYLLHMFLNLLSEEGGEVL